MNAVRVTVETDTGFVQEIGWYASMQAACAALEQARAELRLETVPEDDPYDRWTVKLRWVDDELPW